MYVWCFNLWGKTFFAIMSDKIPVHLLSVFIFYDSRWRFVLQTEISGKYISPLYFCFLSLFFYHSSCRKDHFTVLSLKFGTQDFTDPGLLKIRRTHTGLSLWFCLHKCFWYPGVIPFVSYIGACVPQVVWFFSRFVHENGSAHYSLKRVPFSMKPQEYINVFLPKNLRINLGF